MDQSLADAGVRRRLYLTLALKRVRPGSGSSPEFLRKRTWRRPVFDLTSIVSVPFVIVGGIATRLYAAERVTDDIDVLIMAHEAARFYQDLAQTGGQRVGSLSIGGSEWRLTDGTTLDVLESEAPWAREAIQAPVTAGPDNLPVIGLPYLVLMKMLASWGIDIGDLTRMLGSANEDSLGQVRTVIGKHLPDAADDLESLILLGRLEQGQADVRLKLEG